MKKHSETLEQFLNRAADVIFPMRMFDRKPKVLTVQSRGADDDMALHVAALWGDRHAINLLLDAGADIEAAGDMSCTPLFVAVSHNRLLAAEALLLRGANPNASNEFNTSPRQRAERSGDKDMIKLFKKYK